LLQWKTTKLIPTGMSTKEFITGWKKAKNKQQQNQTMSPLGNVKH
jgi:hypothetical protein